MRLQDIERRIIKNELERGATLSDASWVGANAIIAILDGDMDPETAGAYGVTRNEYLKIFEIGQNGRR